ncbi:hypothetical protein SAMN05216266_117128 [Amycolatopsis marina]|uniref:Uncharacterized protein n=2 Tax=Amycolatopsis TaxID=1813 RepID=A0A1I1BVP2_9PSEU|nr:MULTISPECIES: hypothetical protein [Pseudonocardiaceae]PXY17531.1 hypothetical protein BAY59_36345 [Prauserella coralliicola]MBE1579437.1 hypothetical protein [Amycolatopsis roodepoortensis]TWE14898.1 hypothetical protein FHX69_7061 [Prauserella muralis]SDU63328.1 hypothetical protein SAMN04489733_7377 [Amycolatopsis keratiniphila]SFB53902.1 hypothetical protein SAMN05216266_117128 [Amycolatopsis marina]
MTPTHGNGSPGDGSQEHGPTDPPTVPIPLPQRRRTPRLRTLRLTLHHPRPAQPSTVWPCAQDELREGTGLLANWLLTAVIKIVTTYTQPGQRMLLLAPAPYLAPPASWSPTAGRNQSRPGPYAGLHEAGWTVVRLGRSIRTQTAVAHPNLAGEHSGDASAEAESGPRPRTASPTTDQPAEPWAHRRPGPHSTATGVGPDRYDLVITTAEPRTLDGVRPADWAGLLTPTGTLAVITHGERARGRLTDPASSLVRAAHHAGLRYIDRIALLRVPVRDGALAVATPATHSRSQAPARPLATPARHIQVHDDLFVFTRQPAPTDTADGEETSNG